MLKLMYASACRKIWGTLDGNDVEQALYVAGELQPHYPVPAINGQADRASPVYLYLTRKWRRRHV